MMLEGIRIIDLGQVLTAPYCMEHRLAQSFIYQVAAMVDAGQSLRKEGYMAKIGGTELGQRVTDRCLQIHGGIGLTHERPAEKMWRDARSLSITEGPVEVMRMVLAREILRSY